MAKPFMPSKASAHQPSSDEQFKEIDQVVRVKTEDAIRSIESLEAWFQAYPPLFCESARLQTRGWSLLNQPELAEQVRVLRNHGSKVRYHHSVIGYNSRLDSLQAAVLSVKLPLLEGWNRQRRANAARYREGATPPERPNRMDERHEWDRRMA